MSLSKILCYLTFLFPWFLSAILFPIDPNYYLTLQLPKYYFQPSVFRIVWPILYLLISYSIFKTYPKSNSNYKIYLVMNYFSNQFFTICFFGLKNNFLAFADTIIIFISSLYLYVETKYLNPKATWYLIPYMIWNGIAVILMLTVLWLNL